jgi:hypothetical protein
MSKARKLSGVLFWIALIPIPLLPMYSLSFGPACWLCNRQLIPASVMPWADEFYEPMVWAFRSAPDPIRSPVRWYVKIWE